MRINPEKFIRRQRKIMGGKRAAFVAIVAIVTIGAGSIAKFSTEASSQRYFSDKSIQHLKPISSPSPEPTPVSNIPPQIPATRIRVIFGEKHDLQIPIGVDSFVLVSPEIASAEIKNRFTLTISGLKIGETILLINNGPRRHTYILDVVAKPSEPRKSAPDEAVNRRSSSSGSFTTMYAQGFEGGPSILRESVDYRRKISKDRTLRVSGEMFKLLGNADRDLTLARVQDFALNRLALGIDTSSKTIDLLDSQINSSTLTFNNYTMRGFHLINTPKSPNDNLPLKGIDIFAGMARPSLAFYDSDGGKIAGAIIPLVSGDKFEARAGVIAISSEKNNRSTNGGTILHFDAAYAPRKEVFADAEMAYANGDLSWRGRLDLKFAKYGASGEITRFARTSPVNSIGAQPGGRRSESMAFYWRPDRRLSSSVGYSHTSITRLAGSNLADFDRSLLFANLTYSINRDSRINLRYTDQKIETAFPGGLSKFEIQTRSFLIGTNKRFNKYWSNSLEARLNFSKEAGAGENLEKGFSVSEQLRFSLRGTSVTGFLNYTNKTPSLTSMIVRNPQLLPPTLQTAFASDPAAFLRTYSDRLAFLLNGIELPKTRNIDAGVHVQKTFSRFTVAGETRYNAGEVYAVNQKQLYSSASLGVRLDNANSLQLNGWGSFGGRSQSGITISYTHQFGSSRDGFQFSKLFNFNRSKVGGRVFYDLNGNGRPDPFEPGVAGMKIQIDGKRWITTDKNGNYQLAANEGNHTVALVSGDLGVRLLADTPTEHRISLGSGQRLNLDFGVRDFGSISGRVFNDIGPSSALRGTELQGLEGVKLILRSVDTDFGSFVLEQVSRPDGIYEFTNLRPGKYIIEIDSNTLPPNFQIPAVTSVSINVEALRGSYYDVPVAAQRAITGIVFVDNDHDRLYTAGKDRPIEGIPVYMNDKSAVSDGDGAYILRNLPAGPAKLMVRLANGTEITSRILELGSGPVTLRSVDLPVNP
jgi:hypothetical protein